MVEGKLALWWTGWRRVLILGVAGLMVTYGAFATFVSVSNGNDVHVYIEAGTTSSGTQFFRCDMDASTPGACDPAGTDGSPDQARITVHKRDRVTMTVHSLDGGGRAHDFKLKGAAYFLPPAGIEMELHKATETKSFTAWKAGEYTIACELPGHEALGMWATFVVS